MKNLQPILTILLICIFFNCNAQLELKYPQSSKNYNFDFIVHVNSELIVGVDYKLRLGKEEIHLTSFDAELNQLKTLELEKKYKAKTFRSRSYIGLGGSLYALITEETRTTKKCFAQEIDLETLEEKGTPQELASISQNVELKSIRATTDFTLSENQKYLALFPHQGEYYLFDEKLNRIAKANSTKNLHDLTPFSNILTNEGVLFQTFTDPKVIDKPGLDCDKRIIIHRIQANRELKQHIIETDEFLIEPLLSVDNEGNLVVAGNRALHETSPNNWTDIGMWDNFEDHFEVYAKFGFFFRKYDSDLNLLSETKHDYPNELYLQGLEPGDLNTAQRRLERGRDFCFYFFSLKDLIQADDGFYLIGERFLDGVTIEEVDFLSSKRIADEDGEDFDRDERVKHIYFGDIVILKLDENGDLEYFNKVLKLQNYRFESGYLPVIQYGKLHVIFNDHEANEDVQETTYINNNFEHNATYVVEVDANETSKYVLPSDPIKSLKIIPSKCKKVGSKTLLIGRSDVKIGAFGFVE